MRWIPMNSPHKGPVALKMIPFDDVIVCMDMGYIWEFHPPNGGNQLTQFVWWCIVVPIPSFICIRFLYNILWQLLFIPDFQVSYMKYLAVIARPCILEARCLYQAVWSCCRASWMSKYLSVWRCAFKNVPRHMLSDLIRIKDAVTSPPNN